MEVDKAAENIYNCGKIRGIRFQWKRRMRALDFVYENSTLLIINLALAVALIVCIVLLAAARAKSAAARRSVEDERKFYSAFEGDTTKSRITLNRTTLKVGYVSPGSFRMLGLKPDYIYNDIETLRELMTRQEARRLENALRAWDKASPLHMECAYTPVGGGAASDNYYASIDIIPDDATDSYYVTISDITREHGAKEDLKEQLRQAYAESQAKTDFLSKMSHEIRTPMNGVLGMLNLARMHADNKYDTVQYLDKAESLSQFLLTLINDILDMSRIESGKMVLENVRFDIFSLADKLNTMFKGTAESKGLHWKVEMQDFDVRYVIGDELRLSQVIVNFISNANKFTNAGGYVTVTFRQMNKIDGKLHLMVRVRDTGKGISRDFLTKIFKPFEQEDASTAHNYGGSGLGMAIADNIIRIMNGQILVESEVGKGSEFIIYVSLPIAPGEQDIPEFGENGLVREAVPGLSAPGGETAQAAAAAEYTLDGLNILLAEDNDINAEIAIEIMEMDGAKIERAVDGVEAVRMFAESAPGTYDVILMDIQMPNLDGWEATKQIRALDKADADIPIFAMSANAFVEDKRHSLEVGMNGHISKPIDFDEVRRLVCGALEDKKGG